MFITIEGIEGCGKSTQSRKIGEYLANKNIPYILTREPGGESGAEEIRNLLVRGDVDKWEDITELLLFLAARVQHINRLIRPALKAGKIVICDRFVDSTIAYQGVGKGLSEAYYNMLHNSTLGNFTPDMTILLDLPVKNGLNRSLSRQNIETRFEDMDISFHNRVRTEFLKLAKDNPHRIVQINALQNINDIHKEIICKLGL